MNRTTPPILLANPVHESASASVPFVLFHVTLALASELLSLK